MTRGRASYARVASSEGHPHRPKALRPTTTAFVFALLFMSNIAFLGLWLQSTQLSDTCVKPKLSYSPARTAIKYEPRRLYRDIDHNDFTGDPRPEFDAAWNHLLQPMTIKISKEELSNLPDSSIAFKDGSGYIAELAVYHELHCIKRLRRHFHLDRYYPNMTADEWEREQTHVNHCLEYWREAAICRGDTTLSTFQWLGGLPYSRVYSDHECVNWATLDGWARGRMVNMTSFEHLVAP
ncbi:oxidase ustYa family protein [Aspergillus luchuensis]|uniref:Tat pathway signal sequence n=2 Tax=Aspergillus kawachii TaxID=1069201 RepID=A0A146FXN4_ASPKA|nr:uncharacterized protein AKAW2_61023A [Aspergillus luchuensis]BCS02759.1 hypothetical protein AKAW2_61023A [Aspergillus luchuensis]BCS14414.1 hypothetical protein ALUC_60970A [Aspergillus luchuensis]GAT30067.1 hypothetical protein RIB2604_03300390 [Aspergillus luchuensis]